jgi:hypothetical protein
MYLFKDKELAKKFNKNEMAKEVGLHSDTIRKTLNQGKPCSKVIAYCITKFIDKDAEILDYFIFKNE